MRIIKEYGPLHILSPQALSVLQFRALSEPLLPNLKVLHLLHVRGESIPFIPLLLSPRTTTIHLRFSELDLHRAVVASMINTLPMLCPNLHAIHLTGLPRDPMITAAVSELALATNQNTLRHFCVDSSLTEEACEVIRKHPDLRTFHTVIDRPNALPTMVLPNLTNINIAYNLSHDWLQGFRGASLGKLTSVTIASESDLIVDFLGAFESAALTTSIPGTLSSLVFHTERPWRPIYRSLLPFTQLKILAIWCSCEPSCSSTVDDDIITDLARAMPKLEVLGLGNYPCKTAAGVTVKGLTALAHYCPHLLDLTIHFQVASLDPPAILCFASPGETPIPQQGCALKYLHVGDISVPEESTLMVALTLVNIFPHLECVNYSDVGWEKVANAIQGSKHLVHSSSENVLFVVS